MTLLTFVMTIINICDGDKHPNLRHKFTIQNMIDFNAMVELGNNIADVTFFDSK